MSKMKMFLIPVMVAASVAAAVPAAAQPMGPHGRPTHSAPPHAVQNTSLNSFIDRKAGLELRIERAMDQRRLERRKGVELKRELMSIEREARASMRGGLQRSERQRLERRLDQVQMRLDREMRHQPPAPRGPHRR